MYCTIEREIEPMIVAFNYKFAKSNNSKINFKCQCLLLAIRFESSFVFAVTYIVYCVRQAYDT